MTASISSVSEYVSPFPVNTMIRTRANIPHRATTQPTAPRNSSLFSCTLPLSWHVSVSSDACGSWAARVSCAASPDARSKSLLLCYHHHFGSAIMHGKDSKTQGRRNEGQERKKGLCNNIQHVCHKPRWGNLHVWPVIGLAFVVFLLILLLLLDGGI